MTTKQRIEEAAKDHEIATDEWRGLNPYAFDDFTDGANFGAALEQERSKKLVEALKKIRKDLKYAVENAKLGGEANFILSSKDTDCYLAIKDYESEEG